jgi:large subunit ribosomal protein L3
MIGLIGRKVGMDQLFMPDGRAVAVTLVEAGPCPITQVKTKQTDGYNAIQLGFGKAKRMNKPMTGKLKAVKVEMVATLMEVRVTDPASFKVGSRLDVTVFKEGDLVKVVGYTKGRGFAGGVKRWGWAGGPATHGSCFHRAPGSIGQHTYPGRVWKNRRMPGHYGDERVSIKNLKIMKVEKDKNLVLLWGAIPGPRRGLVLILKKDGN